MENSKYQLAIFSGRTHKWSAHRDSEHTDFTLYCEKGEVWVSVERTEETDKHCTRFEEGKESYLLDIKLVEKIITAIYAQNLDSTFFDTDEGLVWREEGRLE